MMHMTFYWGKNMTLLFNFWKTNTWINYSLTLIVCFLFSIFYQYLENHRLAIKSLPSSSSSQPISSSETPLLSSKKIRGNWIKAFGAVLFGVNSAVGYMLMLSVMSFNGGVFVVIVIGLSVGYFLFRFSDDEEAGVGLDSACACA